MPDAVMETAGPPAEMDLLMFNAAGVRIAVATGQVDCVMSPEQARQQGLSSRTLSEILGLGKEASSASATVILYRNGLDADGITVNGLDAIISVPVRAIQPLPEPLAYFPGPRLFWGVVLQGNDVVLLIDLHRLKGLNLCKAAVTA